jgi:DNA-binding response OmpR family regulator
MLKSEGFNVYTTDLGEEGVDLGKLYDYDIILLDINLPDMSGYEVRQHKARTSSKPSGAVATCSATTHPLWVVTAKTSTWTSAKARKRLYTEDIRRARCRACLFVWGSD